MSEAASALGGATFDGLVRVEDRGPRGMIALRGDLGSAAFERAITDATGVGMPGPLEARLDGERGVLWMSPDELLLLCARDDAGPLVTAMSKALDGEHALVADVSDARAVVRLSGPHLRDVIAKIAPIDMSQTAMPPGRVRRTRLAQVPAALWLVDATTADILCFRSVAGYVFDLLSNAARPGSAVGHF